MALDYASIRSDSSGLARRTSFSSSPRRASRSPAGSDAETDGTLRVLDLKRDEVRQAVGEAKDAKALYRSKFATNY